MDDFRLCASGPLNHDASGTHERITRQIDEAFECDCVRDVKDMCKADQRPSTHCNERRSAAFVITDFDNDRQATSGSKNKCSNLLSAQFGIHNCRSISDVAIRIFGRNSVQHGFD